MYAIPDSGEVGLLYDIDDNHGGGLQTRICGATFSGTLADLAAEYPQLVLGEAPPPSPPPPIVGTASLGAGVGTARGRRP